MREPTYTTNEIMDARRQRVEALARIIAAQKMGLVLDPVGEVQSPEMWSRYISFANELLNLVG